MDITTADAPDSDLVERRAHHLWPCTKHFYANPPHIERGSMQFLFDARGKRYLDLFSGVSVVHCGHCNPEILAAVVAQMGRLQHTTTIYVTAPMIELAEALAERLPGDLRRTMFVNSGSEANETACLLASLVTGRNEFLALRHGLHGRTKLGMSLTGLGMWRLDPTPVGGVSFLRNPHCLRCPLERDRCELACADEVEVALDTQTTGQPAAFIAEPVQGNGGIIPMPAGYLARVCEIMHRHGALLILDEVQTGFGRTGTWFAFEQDDVMPDIVTFAKGLGNGVPIGACATRDDLAEVMQRPSASTTGGNPVSAAAGLAVLKYLHEHGLIERSRELGAWLKQELTTLGARHEGVAEVRGRGLMLGMELVLNHKDLEPDPERCDEILEQLKERGFLAGKSGPGRNVLSCMPPLVVEREDLAHFVSELDTLLGTIRIGGKRR